MPLLICSINNLLDVAHFSNVWPAYLHLGVIQLLAKETYVKPPSYYLT